MNIFRRLIGSKLGGVIALLFIGVIALAFILGDINNNNGTGGLFGPSSGEVARVGKQSLTVAEVQSRAQQIFEQMRQERPNLTMNQFLAEGGLDQTVDAMIAARAIAAYGEKQGFRVSKALIDAEIARIPAFGDATGKFNEAQFRALLAQRGIQEKDLRADIANQIMEQQIITPARLGAFVPETMVGPYARMLIEQRKGEAVAVPSVRFAPKEPPAENVLRAYYNQNQAEFSVPEQRKLRYMLVERSKFEATATPTEAEIAAAYKSRAAQYAARDSRSFTQLIVPTEAAARDLAAKAKGSSLSAVASAAGLSTSKLSDIDKAGLTGQSNAALANAAFGAAQGALVGPIRAPLGWTLIHVDEIRSVPARSLADVRAELVAELSKTKAAQAFSDDLSAIDGQIGDGATFAEIAKARGLQILETPMITAQGVKLGDPLYKPDETLNAILKQGFAMGTDDDPQIAPVRSDEVAAIVAVAESTPAGPMPFAQARAGVTVAWTLSQGAAKAKAAADALAKAISSGQSVAQAMAATGLTGSQTQPIEARRGDITRGGAQVPPPLAALFTMKAGTAKVLPLDQKRGFVVVRLDSIVQGDPGAAQQLVAPTRSGLKDVFGEEYAQQLAIAARQEVGVTRNAAAIAAIAKALREANGSAQ
ncbi:SurA N-terminal domain-containing protein [Sphingobium sp. CR28]|uniref:SurA N-terminal domain-containing protein n=1 Tax=Sphingobium sp. CR28 TaxID=3400272 RepID=UPI003FF07880